MTYTVSNIINSIAGALAPLDYPVYASQTQQGITTPCFFISLMPSDSKSEVGGRYLNELNLDVVFLQEPNIANATDGIYAVLDYLNENLEMFEYSDGTNTGYLHTYDRRHHLEVMDLHYQFSIKTRTYIDAVAQKMLKLEGITYEIKRKG